jgi:hypothetical protein
MSPWNSPPVIYMKIKESLLLASLAALIGLPISVHAAPLVSIGDNVDVFFNGSSSLQWQSNVFYNEKDEEEDLLLTVSPGFEVNIGRGVSNLDLSIITRYDILRYDDLSHLDDEYFHIKAIGSYQSSRWDVNGLVSFDEEQSTTGQEGSLNTAGTRGEIIQSDNTRANLEGEYRLSPKFSVGSGVRYYDREYTSHDSLADRETVTIPLDVFYELTPKVDLSLGYRYTSTDVGDTKYDNGVVYEGYDKESHFFNIGARGNLLPKLTGFFKVGYTVTDPDSSDITFNGTTFDKQKRDSQGTLGLDADFTYLATPKVTTRLKLHRGFGVGGEGQSTENTSANLSASYAINANYSASAFGGYTLREYEESDREDNIYSIGARFSYVPNQYWRFSTGYAYSENDSDRKGQSYESHTLDLSASLRY